MAKTITLGLRIRGHLRQVGKPFLVSPYCLLSSSVLTLNQFVGSATDITTSGRPWVFISVADGLLFTQQYQPVQRSQHDLLPLPGLNFHFLFRMLNTLNNFCLGIVYKRHLRPQCGHCQPIFYLHLRCWCQELVNAVSHTEHFWLYQFRRHFGSWHQCVLWVFSLLLFRRTYTMLDNVYSTEQRENLGIP